MNKWLQIIIAVISLSCKNEKVENLQITIDKVFTTDVVSSGSGLCVINDSIYIVGDDAEYISKFSPGDSSLERMSLYPQASFDRIPKPVKHDLESCFAATINDESYLFAFGSGGISPYRDTLFAVNVKDTLKNFKRSLFALYAAIKSKTALKENELNIEAATLVSDKLLLFNRGKNFIVVIDWKDFTKFILDDKSANAPAFEIFTISLPEINGYQVGFSGACTLSDKEILFTASLEETTDFIADGVVKGSYIGILDISDGFLLKAFNPLEGGSREVLLEKLESIDILKSDPSLIKAIAVADNDDGTSKIFELSIKRE